MCGARAEPTSFINSASAYKELRESRFWIRLVIKSKSLPATKMARILDECNQLCKVIAKSIVTAKSKATRKNRRSPL